MWRAGFLGHMTHYRVLIQVSNLSEIKGNLLHGGLFNITGLYSHALTVTTYRLARSSLTTCIDPLE